VKNDMLKELTHKINMFKKYRNFNIFMSLLNIGYLTEAINEKGIHQPNEVFNFIRERLQKTLSKDGQRDGFDGILLCIDTLSNNISYAAANNSAILIREGQLIKLDADRMPVGMGDRKDSFSLGMINTQKDDILYLYTDGYADQFGGPKGKKFKYKQLNELLLALSNRALTDQLEILNSTFCEWRGDLEQVDDVCVVGIKFT
jgi:serine phosphatase RsbU (regulator of sigma subunit)